MLSRASVAFWWRPDGHGSGAAAPSAQKEPDVQPSHAVVPGRAWNLPATQSVHSFWPATGCTVPGLHGLCVSEPVEHDEPAGQAVHWPSLPRPDVLLNDPSLHGSGADAPASQYEPAVHSKQDVSPCPDWYVPASHIAHVPCCAAGCSVPGLHGL